MFTITDFFLFLIIINAEFVWFIEGIDIEKQNSDFFRFKDWGLQREFC